MRARLAERPVFRLVFRLGVRPLNDIRLDLLFFFFFLLIAIIRYFVRRFFSQVYVWRFARDKYAASIILVHRSLMESPVFAAAIGKSEWLVKPGIVLTSSA